MSQLSGQNKSKYVVLGLTFGAGIGAGFGIVLGSAVFGDVSIGLTLGAGSGACLGLVFGAAFAARKMRHNDGEKSGD